MGTWVGDNRREVMEVMKVMETARFRLLASKESITCPCSKIQVLLVGLRR